jgi:hypothetical protein
VLPDRCFAYCGRLRVCNFGRCSALAAVETACFTACSALSFICHPQTVARIGAAAFWRCSALSVLDFGRLAFVAYDAVSGPPLRELHLWDPAIPYLADMPELEAVSLGSATEVPECAFELVSIREITIAKSVRVLGCGCFRGCPSLERLMFEDGSQLEIVMESAAEQTRLREICIPASIREIVHTRFSDAICF